MFYQFTTDQLLIIALQASIIVDDIVTRDENEERHIAILGEIMRPLQYPYLVSYEAFLEGVSADKYCKARLKKLGVKGRHIQRIKALV